MIWIYSISHFPASDFNQADWNSNIEARYRMSEDIIESKMLIGKTHKEVIEVLGSGFSSKSVNRITYEIGHVPWVLNIDPNYIEIKFESNFVIGVNEYRE